MKKIIIRGENQHMKLVEKELESIFEKTLEKIYPEFDFKGKIGFQTTANEKFGDFQTNFAMVNSKTIQDKPQAIAKKIIDSIIENNLIEKMEIAGPGFLNIFLKETYLNEYIKKLGKENYDFSHINTKGEVVIDYSSPNIAKRMHIAHLRSTVIGDSIKRIYRKIGYKVVADNHIGDWGTQFGKLIIGYRNWLDKESYEKNPIEELERIYVEFSNRAEENPELEDQARNELKKLHDNDEENLKLWKEFIEVSLKEYGKIYNRLDIEFDTYYGESYYHEMMGDIVALLKEKKLCVEDEGAQVVFFDEKDNLPPCIVQKKDGAYLYATSDLACINFRQKNYNLNKIIIVTDERQQDHFKQFFRISEMLGWEINKEHVWFGIMRFADGIFSTRKGNIIKLEELLDESKRRVREVVEIKNQYLSEEEKNNIAEVVGIGAVKYADLSQNRISPVIFEWDKILSFEGNTAPYLQYSYARIKSILRKAKEEGRNIDENAAIILKEQQERALAMQLLNFPTAILRASEANKPNIIADYLFETAKKFNTFYNALPIVKEEENIFNSRIILAEKTSIIIKDGLNLLGIKTVERM